MSIDASGAMKDQAEYYALIESIKGLDDNLSAGLPPKKSFWY